MNMESRWDRHKFKCPICRRHVSIDGLIIREKQLCSKGRKLAKAAWSMAETSANRKATINETTD